MSLPDAPLHIHERARSLIEAGARGFVLSLPGGGYQTRSDHEGAGIADFLAAHGIAAGYLDYSVAPHRYPTSLMQTLLALAQLRHGEPSWNGPIAVIGFSAGGHLAATVSTATEDERAQAARISSLPIEQITRPDLVSLAYPVASLVRHPHIGSRINLIGEDGPDSLARALSAENRVDAGAPPLFCWHTFDDDDVPVENSLQLVAAWRAANIPAELHIYPSGPHGIGLASEFEPPLSTWPAAWLTWLAAGGITAADH